MSKAKTTVRKTTARLAPGFVKIKFPTKEAAVANKNFHSCDIEEDIIFCDDDGNECVFPFQALGKEVIASTEYGGYYKKEDAYTLDISSEEVEMFHTVIKITGGGHR